MDIKWLENICHKWGKKGNGRKELSCFIVENDAEGFTQNIMKDKMMWRGSNTGELVLENVRVHKSAMLGKQGEGFKQMLSTLDRGRLSIAAMGLGLAQGAYEYALKYAKERKTFGKPIAQYQANAFKLADIEIGLEMARNYLYDVCRMLEEGENITKEGAIAKLYCSELAHMSANHCVQILGGLWTYERV